MRRPGKFGIYFEKNVKKCSSTKEVFANFASIIASYIIIMKKVVALLSLFLCSMSVMYSQTTYKVDINEWSRSNMDEVLEPSFTPWRFEKDTYQSTLTMDDGVVFRIHSKQNMRAGWNKGFVQTKEENCRLTGDGVALDPNECGQISLSITGLAPGRHTIQTYHNSWQDPEKAAGWPITLSVGGEVVHQSVPRTFRKTVASEAMILTTVFTVASEEETFTLTISTSEEDAPADAAEKSVKDRTPLMNGFLVDAVSASAQAKRPYPADADMHLDADSGFVQLSWSPASDAVLRHRLYLSTSLENLEQADLSSACLLAVKEAKDTTYVLKNVRNLDTYYWRVDEESVDGSVTRGETWRFRPRHVAFPGAEGYGRFANGGRGGKVVYVTNLNDSGEGSFRQAATSGDGPRTIIFDVSGIIALESRLVVDDEVTIAGQTAPGKGICFRKSPIGLSDDNICRFVRMRLGSGKTADGIGMGGVSESIMDHCSISWTIDEAFSSRNAKNITLQRTLISEALSMADHKNYESGTDHGFAGSIGGDIGTFHHNLLANNSGRNWSLAGGLDGNGYLQGRLDIFNMVVYNWCRQACYNGAHEVNFVNNYYKRGPATNQRNATKIMLSADPPGLFPGTQRYYFKGNVMPGVFDESNQEKGRTPNGAEEKRYDQQYYKQWVDEPFFPSYAKIESARDAYKSVLSDVGANQPVFDDHDLRMIDETLHGTYHYVGSRSGNYGLIDSENDCGGYEDYGNEVRPLSYDSDRDGLPDWWENLCGSNPDSSTGDFSDSNADPDGDGYTQLEDYLNWLAEPHYLLTMDAQQEVDLASLFAGYTASPSYQAEVLNGMVQATLSDKVLLIKAREQGFSTIEISVKDSEGSGMTRRVNVAVVAKSPTGLTLPGSDALEDAPVYGIDGIRKSAPGTGINIQSGKKFILK